jgi:hypothetical protein
MVNIDFFIRGEDREIFFHSKLGQIATCPCGLRFLRGHLWAQGVQARASAGCRLWLAGLRRRGVLQGHFWVAQVLWVRVECFMDCFF